MPAMDLYEDDVDREEVQDLKTLIQEGTVLRNGDQLIFNPFNPVNQEITLNDVQSILARYGVTAPIHNLQLYKRAFVHASYTKRPVLDSKVTIMACPGDCVPLKTKSNERLEFLGDGVLELITKYYLYRRFPKGDEGFMTEKKIALVKNEHIGKVAYDMQLNRWLLLSKYAEEKKTRTNLKKLGCLFEAFIGALFLDFNHVQVHDEARWFDDVFVTGPGFQMAQIFVEKVFEAHVDWTRLISIDDNFKNILQVKIQKEFKTTPDYLELSRTEIPGETLAAEYEMGVFLCLGKPLHELQATKTAMQLTTFAHVHEHVRQHGWAFVFLGSGQHKIKKKAEQIACENAIRLLDG